VGRIIDIQASRSPPSGEPKPTAYSIAAFLKEGGSPDALFWQGSSSERPLWMLAAMSGTSALNILRSRGCSFAPFGRLGPMGSLPDVPLASAQWIMEALASKSIPLHEPPLVAWKAFRAHASRSFKALLMDERHRAAASLDDSQQALRSDAGLPPKPGTAVSFEQWARTFSSLRERLQALAGPPPAKAMALADQAPHWLDAALRLSRAFCSSSRARWTQGLEELMSAHAEPSCIQAFECALAEWAGQEATRACKRWAPLDLAVAAKTASPLALACAFGSGSTAEHASKPPLAVYLLACAEPWLPGFCQAHGASESCDIEASDLLLPMIMRVMSNMELGGSQPEPVGVDLLIGRGHLGQDPEAEEIARQCLHLLGQNERRPSGLLASFPLSPTQGSLDAFLSRHPLRVACSSVMRWAETLHLQEACADAEPTPRKRPSL
jgi:hypothetical protein